MSTHCVEEERGGQRHKRGDDGEFSQWKRFLNRNCIPPSTVILLCAKRLDVDCRIMCMIILIFKWLLNISPAATPWSNDLPWQCQHYNRVKILLVLSWLVIQLQGKMKLGFPPIDRGLMVSLLLCVLRLEKHKPAPTITFVLNTSVSLSSTRIWAFRYLSLETMDNFDLWTGKFPAIRGCSRSCWASL